MAHSIFQEWEALIDFEWSSTFQGGDLELNELVGSPRIHSELVTEVQRRFTHGEFAGMGAVCVLGAESGQGWNHDRFHDAVILNDLTGSEENGIQVRTYSVAVEMGSLLEEQFDDLRGFSAADVEVRVPSRGGSLSDWIVPASERDYLLVGIPCRLEYGLERVAEGIAECAGLEVPFRLLNLKGNPYTCSEGIGLVNATVAAVLYFAEELAPRTIETILSERSPDAFRFLPSEVAYREIACSTDAIRAARTVFEGVSVSGLGPALRALTAALSQ